MRSAVSSFFAEDPDKVHDRKVSGLPIDLNVTAAKTSLRRLRDAIEATVTLYTLRPPPKKKGGVPQLLLPEMAEWSRHEAFCGGIASGELMHRTAARLAAIEELIITQRTAVSAVVSICLGDEAKALCKKGLDAIYAFELMIRDASDAKEAANKALKRATSSRDSALDGELKAASIKDERKMVAAHQAAKAELEKAMAAIEQAEATLARADAELVRLVEEAQPVALKVASSARRDAENGPLSQAAEELAKVYRSFARGVVTVRQGDSLPTDYNPSVKRLAPKETTARYAAYVVQWTLAKRRCKESAALIEEFSKATLDTLLAPAQEKATIEALAHECEGAQLISSLRAVPFEGKPAHEEAERACRMALAALVAVLGDFRVLLKGQVTLAEEYEKKDKALKLLVGKRDEAAHQVSKLEGELGKLIDKREEEWHAAGSKEGAKAVAAVERASASLEKKSAEHAKLVEEVALKTTALEQAAAEIEAFAAGLSADGSGSVMELVAYPFAEGVRAFTTLCASRAEQAGTNQPFFEHASAAALWAIKLYEQKEREAAAKALAEGPSLALRALAFASQRAEEAGARARARAAEKLSELQARNAARQGRVNSAMSDEAGTGNRRANQGDVPPKPLLLAVLKPPCSALEWEEMLPALRQAAASRGGIGSGVAGSTDAGLVVVGAGLDVCNGFYKHVPDDALANGKPFFRNDDRSVPFFQQTTIGWSDTEWTRKKGYPEGVGCWGIAYDGHHRYMARGDSPFPPTTGWEVREDPKWKYPSVAPTLDLAHMAVPHTERLLRGVHPEAVAKVLLALMQLDDCDESGLDAAAASAAHIRSQLVDDSSAESVSMREAKPEMCGDLDVILNDIPRTWPDWQIETVGESGRFSAEDLRVILDAQVCAAESDLGAVGYSQGMADLAAWLLMRPLSRTAAYSALRRFSSLPLLRLCWRLDLDEWDALGELHTALIRRDRPVVAAHLDRIGISAAIYLPEWLMPIWCRSLSEECVAVVFSLMLLEGDAVILLVASAVIACIEAELLATRDIAVARKLMSDAPQRISLPALVGALAACTLTQADLAPLCAFPNMEGLAPPGLARTLSSLQLMTNLAWDRSSLQPSPTSPASHGEPESKAAIDMD